MVELFASYFHFVVDSGTKIAYIRNRERILGSQDLPYLFIGDAANPAPDCHGEVESHGLRARPADPATRITTVLPTMSK